MARVSADERRAALVQAAMMVIDRDGVNGATTRAIVAEAGMSLASFHYAFRSRDELISELIRWVVQNEQQVSLAALRPGMDARSAVRAALQAFFELVAAQPSHEQAMFELMFYALRTPELDGLPGVQYARYFRVARELLQAATELLGIRWSLPMEQLERVLVAATDGLTLAWLADRDDAAAARLMDATADILAAFAVHGDGPIDEGLSSGGLSSEGLIEGTR